MRIVDASDERAIERLVAPAAQRDAAFERRVQAIVDGVRTGGDRALARYARRFAARSRRRRGTSRASPSNRSRGTSISRSPTACRSSSASSRSRASAATSLADVFRCRLPCS